MWVGGAAKDPVQEAEKKLSTRSPRCFIGILRSAHTQRATLTQDDGFIGEVGPFVPHIPNAPPLTPDDGSIGEDGVLRSAYADAHASLWTTASWERNGVLRSAGLRTRFTPAGVAGDGFILFWVPSS